MEKIFSVDALVSGGFRYPLVVNLLPGAFALAPFVIALSASNENLSKFFTDFPWAFYTAYMGLSLILGHILEDIGSRIELLIEKPNGSESNWNRYLALKIKDEYIAQRYLRTIVFRLKFELSMIAALAVSLAGVFVLVFAAPHYIAMTTGVLIGMGMLTCIIYLGVEARSSSRLTRELREELISAVEKEIEASAPRA